jgi:hypothetical protein
MEFSLPPGGSGAKSLLGVTMFGMLDYRAHKLFWLLCLPLKLCTWLTRLANVVLSIIIANSTSYPLIVKVIIGNVVFELIGMVLFAFWIFVYWLIQRVFFWLVDVVPSKGENAEEAREVVVKGRIIQLSKTFMTDIGSMTLEEAIELSRLPNWRAKLLFNARDRLGKRFMILWRHHQETGQQPQDLRPDEIKQLVGHLDFTKFESVVTSQVFFNSFLGFSLITLALIYLGAH